MLDRREDIGQAAEMQRDRDVHLGARLRVPIEIVLIERAFEALDVRDAPALHLGQNIEEAIGLIETLIGVDIDLDLIADGLLDGFEPVDDRIVGGRLHL